MAQGGLQGPVCQGSLLHGYKKYQNGDEGYLGESHVSSDEWGDVSHVVRMRWVEEGRIAVTWGWALVRESSHDGWTCGCLSFETRVRDETHGTFQPHKYGEIV